MTDCITMIKYQGLGNDYLVLDPNKNRVQLQGKKIALLCQRGFGLGADGILYGPIEIDGKMGVRIFNSDGSEAAISGNGVRIFAKYLMDHEYVKEQKFSIQTLSGPIEVECLNNRATEFRVKMGKASFISREIPVTGEVREVINESFTFHNKEYKATCLTVGNPHCIIFMNQVTPELAKELGPYVENADEFPFDEYDYIVDAVDTVTAKIALVMKAQEKNIPIMSSMGAGNKLDASAFKVADIYKTSMCPLAKVMRRELKKRGVKKLKVVYSEEKPTRPIEDMSISCRTDCICPPGAEHKCTERRDIPGSLAFVPSVAGLIIAGEVVQDIAFDRV